MAYAFRNNTSLRVSILPSRNGRKHGTRGTAEKSSNGKMRALGFVYLGFSSVDRRHAALMAITVAVYLEIDKRELYFIYSMDADIYVHDNYADG